MPCSPIAATFAPAIGPTIGGYLTENWGWEYIFYLNLVPGLPMLALLWFSLERQPMQLGLLRQGDWWGIATMSIGLGALQTALEEGNKDDWLGSPFIVRLLRGRRHRAAAPSSGSSCASAHPLLNLRLLLRRNFGFGVLAMFLLGVALYGSVFILPVYLAQVQGYNAEQIGMVLAWTGLPQLLLIPLVPRLMRRFDARYIVALGFGLFALSNFMNVALSTDIAADQLLLPNIVRAIGQALVLTPLTALASAGIEAENTGSASALLNVMRNLGGAIGIALLQTFLTKREQFHSNVLGQSVSRLRRGHAHPARQARALLPGARCQRSGGRLAQGASSRSATGCTSRPSPWPSATPSICWAPRWSWRSSPRCCSRSPARLAAAGAH